MKKAFLITSLLILLLLCSISVSAFENSMTNTYLVSDTNGYTFESVITPTVTAECMPIIAMYDSDDILCGLMYGGTLSLTSGTPVVETFTVNPDSSPSSIKLMLWKTDGSFAPLCRFEQVSTSLHSEKYGMIVESSSGTGIKLYTTDAVSKVYDFSDKFVLSYKDSIVSDKASAYSYIDSLKLTSYQQIAHVDTNNDGKADSWSPSYDWIISYDDDSRYSELKLSALPTVLHSDCILRYNDFTKNYAARMVRVLVSGDNKIVSMAFADDSLFDKFSKGELYSEAFYTQSTKSFNDSFVLSDNAKLLYLPAREGASESQFTVLAPSDLKNGNLYYIQKFTTASGEQIVLITYMLSDSELAAFNTKPLENISVALNGNGSNIKGITKYPFNISLDSQSDDNNDIANDAAYLAMDYVAKGLQGALSGANDGYAITRNYVKTKFRTEINAAREQINILSDMDTNLSTSYYNELKNEIPNAIGNSATSFLEDYFLSN